MNTFVEENYAFRILPNSTGLSGMLGSRLFRVAFVLAARYNVCGDALGVSFQLDAPGHAPTVAPEEVGAHVLRKLLDNAYRYFGHKQVCFNVVCVYFVHAYRVLCV